jgi:hypothetical protein
MYLCSSKVALLTLAGPIGLGILVFGCFAIFRKWTAQSLAACARKIPSRFRYIVAPVIATFLFTIIWSGTHYGMALGFGLMPQILFPMVTGLFSWTVARYDSVLRHAGTVGSFLAWRDRVHVVLRTAVALLFSFLLSLSITFQGRVTHAASKEQMVVVVTLVTGYILLSPECIIDRNRGATNEP